MAEDLIMEVCRVGSYLQFSHRRVRVRKPKQIGVDPGGQVVLLLWRLEADFKRIKLLLVSCLICLPWLASPRELSDCHQDQAGMDLHI